MGNIKYPATLLIYLDAHRSIRSTLTPQTFDGDQASAEGLR